MMGGIGHSRCDLTLAACHVLLNLAGLIHRRFLSGHGQAKALGRFP